jgi:Tfp pilus assembly protein PilF
MALDDDDFAGAVRFARLALHIDVADVETHKILAAGYAGLKEFSRAAEEWSVALKLKPDALDVEVELARAEAAAGNPEAALKRLNDLLDRDPQNERAIKLRSELK